MFHVKQITSKTFDAQPLKKGCIKCFAVKDMIWGVVTYVLHQIAE